MCYICGSIRPGVHASNSEMNETEITSVKPIAAVMGGRGNTHLMILNLAAVMGDGTVTRYCVKVTIENTEPT